MIILFTHTDLDGVGCAILAKLAFGNDVEIKYCNPSEIDKLVKELLDSGKEYEMCHITDLSVSDDVAKEVDEKCNHFMLRDHHETALELNKYRWCHVEVEDVLYNIPTSGTELYCDWLIGNGYLTPSNTLYNFVKVIRDYDTWRWSTLGEEGLISKKINDLFYIYGTERFIEWSVARIYDKTFPKLKREDELILNMKQHEIDKYVLEKDEQLKISTLCGHVFGYVFADRYISELGNKLCSKHPEIDFIAMIDMGKNSISYRTVKDGIHLGQDIAKKFGGGGHAKAAGSPIPKTFSETVVADMFKSMVFHATK